MRARPRRGGVLLASTAAALVGCLPGGALAGSVTALTHPQPLRVLYSHRPLDGTGTQILYASTHNLAGGDPLAHPQIQRFDVSTQARQQIADFDRGVASGPAVSDDGQWLAFLSRSDPLGTNPTRAPSCSS